MRTKPSAYHVRGHSTKKARLPTGWAHRATVDGFNGQKSDMTVFKRKPKEEGFVRVYIQTL